jgi:hypothetical protein
MSIMGHFNIAKVSLNSFVSFWLFFIFLLVTTTHGNAFYYSLPSQQLFLLTSPKYHNPVYYSLICFLKQTHVEKPPIGIVV